MTTIQSMENLKTLQNVVEFLGRWQERTKRDPLVNTFFQLMTVRKMTMAKTVLAKIKRKFDSSIWHQGYLNALDGMVAASLTKGSRSIFINQLKVERSEAFKKKFLQQSKYELHTDFDRGYFSAWADYMHMLKKRG